MMMDAKKQTLRQIMDLMDGHSLGKLPKKGQPKPTAAAALQPSAELPTTPAEALDPDAARQLMDMYGKDDDKADPPAPISGSY